jgi:hypothetical protein
MRNMNFVFCAYSNIFLRLTLAVLKVLSNWQSRFSGARSEMCFIRSGKPSQYPKRIHLSGSRHRAFRSPNAFTSLFREVFFKTEFPQDIAIPFAKITPGRFRHKARRREDRRLLRLKSSS